MGRSPCCEKKGLKKGKWTAEEDEKLINYIKANGEGSWRSLPKNAGLLRCGKSCRLRWFNYLREDLKRGNFTPQEEETIVRLQRNLGNRWSLIASNLPGRTDNEIKNYWNSHLSRKIYIFRSINCGPTPDMFKMIGPIKKRYKSKSTDPSVAQKYTTIGKSVFGPAGEPSGPDYQSGSGLVEESSGPSYQSEPDEMPNNKNMDQADSAEYQLGPGLDVETSSPNYQPGSNAPGDRVFHKTDNPDYLLGLGSVEEPSCPGYQSRPNESPSDKNMDHSEHTSGSRPAEEPSGLDYQPGSKAMLAHKDFYQIDNPCYLPRPAEELSSLDYQPRLDESPSDKNMDHPKYPSGPGLAEEPPDLDYQTGPNATHDDKDFYHTCSPGYLPGPQPAKEPSCLDYQPGPNATPVDKDFYEMYNPRYSLGHGPPGWLSGPNYQLRPDESPCDKDIGQTDIEKMTTKILMEVDEEMLTHLKNFLEDESVGPEFMNKEENNCGPFGPNSEPGDMYACLSPLVSYFNNDKCASQDFSIWREEEEEEEIMIW